MPEAIKITLLIIVLIVILLIFIGILASLINKNKFKKMYLEVDNLLESIITKNNNEEFSINKNADSAYDYEFITPNHIYYIKLIPNFDAQEICINNPLKWQLRKSFNDETMRFVSDVEPLMRLDFKSKGKSIKKLYLIYPNAKSLLKYINECEMIFVQPTTDVGGANVMTYVHLKEHPDLLEL